MEPALEKKVWNPLSLDLNAGTRSKAKPQAKQFETRSFHLSSQPLKSLFAKTDTAKVEPIVEVQEVEEVGNPEQLEAMDKKMNADDDKVETVVAINVVAKGEMQEVLSMKSVTLICQETQVSDEEFAFEFMPEFLQVRECKGVGMLSLGTKHHMRMWRLSSLKYMRWKKHWSKLWILLCGNYKIRVPVIPI